MTAGIPLSQAIGEFLDWLEIDRARSPRTVTEYRADLGRFAAFAGGDDGVPDIGGLGRELLRDYQRHLGRLTTSRGRARKPEPLAVSTRARRLVALRSFLNFAAREEWLPASRAAAIDVPKLPERLPKPLADADRDQLLDALPAGTLPQKRDRAFVLFLLSTGVRSAEARRLDRDDWRPGRMNIIGKRDRERTVLITDRARLAVEDYLAARTDPSPALFIGFQAASKNSPSNRLTAQGANHICRQLALRLGIPPFTPHQLRHTLATFLQETMGDARLTAETLGHRGLASVAGYTAITEARRREAYEQLQRRGL